MNYLAAVNRKFSDNPGGSVRVACDTACRARDAGHSVVMLCQSPKLAAASNPPVPAATTTPSPAPD